MKKARPDTSNPISLSSKRHSLQQDKLIAPQKPEWDTQLQTIDGNNSKTFFSAMKVELSNIRNDFQRLIHREEKNASLGNKEKEVIQQKSGWGTAEKPKSYSSYKQEQRYITEKKADAGSIPKDKDGAQQTVKGFNLIKNFNQAVNFKNKHINARDKEPFVSNNPVSKFMSMETKDEEVKESNYSSVNSKKFPLNFNESSNDKELLLQRIENQRKKQMSAKLQQEISIYKTQNTHLKSQINRLSEENMLLNQRIIKLQAEMSEKAAQIRVDDENLARTKSIASKAQAFEKQLAIKDKELNELQQKCMQFQEKVNVERTEHQKELHFYSQKIKELTFYNNSFYNDNTQLTEENHHLKEVITSLQKLNDDSKRLAAQSQLDWNRKIEHLQKNLKEYQKRELMFQKEIQRLYQEKSHSHREQVGIQKDEILITQENKFSQEELSRLRAELQRQKDINSMVTKKYKEQLQKLNIEAITSSLQQSIHQLTDQNLNLKSQNNTQASKINSLEQQNHALKAEILLYQERDKMAHASRSLTSSQWEEMTEKIQQLQIQNKRLTQHHDYRQLLQDVLAQKDTFDVAFELKDEFQTLLRTAKDQMEQIQMLRFQCQKLQIKAKICEQDKQELRNHIARLEGQLKAFLATQGDQSGIMHKCEQLRILLQQKQKALRDLKQFVRESLAARTT